MMERAVSWLGRDGAPAHITGIPQREDIEFDILEDLLVEFYAR